jgi:type I restriction enzyme S subunit
MNGFLPDYEFDEPAVVLSAIGARCGKCFFAEGKWASLANTQVIFPDPARADAKFLWYQLNDERRWHRSGTGQPFIKPADVKAQRVVLPPLPEQR